MDYFYISYSFYIHFCYNVSVPVIHRVSVSTDFKVRWIKCYPLAKQLFISNY